MKEDDWLPFHSAVREIKRSLRTSPGAAQAKLRELCAAGIASKCVAAYGRLLREGYFIQPTSGLALLNKVKATVNPWQAFMDFYWEIDPTGEGTRCRVFYHAFKHWCFQTRRSDIMETSPSDLIQKINNCAGEDWEFLASFRPRTRPTKNAPATTQSASNPRPHCPTKSSTSLSLPMSKSRLRVACPPGPPEYFYEPGEGRFMGTPLKSPPILNHQISLA